jgi:glutathione synthase/RimK-type ligase-like ATP-grasp enzyme
MKVVVRAGLTVFVRKKLNASSGRGIVVTTTLPIDDAPLYVKSINKTKEFRVHVVADQAIDLQEKRRKNGSRANEMIRNLDNGWVFCRQNIVAPAGLKELGVAAVKAIGLLFGAVDIIFDAVGNRLYVLEVNTAPGLTNSTAINYAKAFLALQN